MTNRQFSRDRESQTSILESNWSFCKFSVLITANSTDLQMQLTA